MTRLQFLLSLLFLTLSPLSLGATDLNDLDKTTYRSVSATLASIPQAVLCAWGDMPYEASERFNGALLQLHKTIPVSVSNLTMARIPRGGEVFETHVCGLLTRSK